MAKRAHIVTIDEARATAQSHRQQSAIKLPDQAAQLARGKRAPQGAPDAAAPKPASKKGLVSMFGALKGAGRSGTGAAAAAGVRKLGSSPKAQQVAAQARGPEAAGGPAPRRASQPLGGRAGRARPSQPLAARPDAPFAAAGPRGAGAPRRDSQPVQAGAPGIRQRLPRRDQARKAAGPAAPLPARKQRSSRPLGAADRMDAGAPFDGRRLPDGPALGARPNAGREVFRFNEYEERAAEQARARSMDMPDAPDASGQPARKPRLAQRLTARFGGARKAAAKSRASRSFDRQYGGAVQSSASAEGAGPRAAVYEGRMGASHKKAAHSLSMGSAAGAALSGLTGSKKRRDRGTGPALRVVVPAVVAACLLFACVFMYGPVQLWYQEMRENDRLQLEYSALQERNQALQSDVDSLGSEAGIEDRVHQQYGWVREDEHAVSVSGLSSTNDIDFIANVSPGSVKAPETWYSALLDPLFGVS